MTVSLAQAREWFNSGNKQLQELAVFDRKELNFRHIVTFKDACEVLGLRYSTDSIIRTFSRSTSAMYKLNIIREARQDLHLTKDPKGSCIYYPYNPFCYKDKLDSSEMEIIGKIRSEGITYNVLGAGFDSFNSVVGFLGCASKEIAEHFGKYFGMLITTAKYADIIRDFEIIESKYII